MTKIVITVIISITLGSCATVVDFFRSRSSVPSSSGEIPSRPMGAMSGSAFAKAAYSLSKDEREKLMRREILSGNIPDFLRTPRPVKVTVSVRGKGRIQGELWVLPDYLAIGSDSDYVRVPMMPMTAQAIAHEFGFVLPTRKMVNDIYRAARIKLSPQPLPASPDMISTDYFVRHNRAVVAQLKGRAPREIIGGHKKDIVVTNKLNNFPERVAIYGWHRLNGHAIQPLSIVHDNKYADYSHGVRLIRRVMFLNGEVVKVADVMQNSSIAAMLSDEGVIKRPELRLSEESLPIYDGKALVSN
jgi:hypothetical protein